MNLNNFIKKRPYLVWYAKYPEKLSKGAVVEAVLNNGDWQDVQELFKIVGIAETARIFHQQVRRGRQNYHPKIANYFTLYFNRYAS